MDLLLTTLPIIFYSSKVSKDFHTTWISDSVESITGLNPEKFIEDELLWISNIHPDDNEAVNNFYEELLKKETAEFVYRWKCADGKYRWFFNRAIVIKDKTNNPKEIHGIWFDITDRKEFEKKIEQSENKFRNLVERMSDLVIQIDANLKIQFVTPSIKQILGYTPEEILGKTFNKYIRPKNIHLVFNSVRNILNGHFIDNLEIEIQRKDDSTAIIQFSGMPIYEQGKIIGIQAVGRDITKRKLVEEQLKTTISEKTVLLREVHHRVKNNLQAIIYLIEMQIDRITDTKVQTFLRELQEQARTMSYVYEQLYHSDTLSQIDMQLYVQNLASSVIQAFGGGKSIKLDVNSDSFHLDVTEAMPCGLVINELLTNSLKYAFPQGYNREPRIYLNITKSEDTITIKIGDNGVGMPKDFDWRKTESLGLKLVNLWVNYQLSGSIDLDNTNGTVFTIKFKKKKTEN